MREIWTDRLDDLRWLPPIRYKGEQTTTQTRTIPNQTAAEAALQRNAANYAGQASNTAGGLLNSGNYLANNISNVLNPYATNAANISSGYGNLVSGNLPSQYATNRQQALNADLTGTVGNAINNLGSRGILNSSVTGGALNNIGQNASNTLANQYSSDLSNYSGLLGNASANNTSNLSNYESLLSNLFGNANQLAGNTSNLFNTMYGGRMGTGTTQSTTSGGGNGTAGLIGQLGSAAILCFAGGTKISTPGGDKNIEDIVVGDKVYSVDGVQTVIYVQEPTFSNDEYMTVIDGDKRVTTTGMQLFITPNGDVLAHELEHIPANKVLVYDFSATGSNTYYANDFLARGR